MDRVGLALIAVGLVVFFGAPYVLSSLAPVPCPTVITGYASASPTTVVTADLLTYSQAASLLGWPTGANAYMNQPAVWQVQGGYTAAGYNPTAVFPGYSYGGNQNYPSLLELNGYAYNTGGSVGTCTSYSPTATTTSTASATTSSSTTTSTAASSTSSATTTTSSASPTPAPPSGSLPLSAVQVFGLALVAVGGFVTFRRRR
jgi:hypothetical protein